MPATDAPLTRAHERLREELQDDGITLPGNPDEVAHLLRELDHARRPPIHEGRLPVYGSFVLPAGRSLVRTDELIDIVDLDLAVPEARRFADGRSTYLVHGPDGPPRLACFRRSVQYEADLVEVQAATGAFIVQRTVMGTARIFTPTAVIEWTGHSWVERPSAASQLDSVHRVVPEASRAVVAGLLNLCVHWLSPARIGATLLLDINPQEHDDENLDTDSALTAPAVSVVQRHHYPALIAVLLQSDLATLVDPDGRVTSIGVGLKSSEASEHAVTGDRGMRHRSAARYTWDHHHTVAFVVSEDGPVTVFRKGHTVANCVG